MLDVADVSNVVEVVQLAITYTAALFSVSVCVIVTFLEETMLRDILEAFVHPTTITAKVVPIAVN